MKYWAACVAAGGVVLVACALPFARLGLHGGDFNVQETIRVVSLGAGSALAVVASGLALLGVGFTGLRFGTHGPALFVTFAALLVVASRGEAGLAFQATGGSGGGILCTTYETSQGGCGGIFGPKLEELYKRNAGFPEEEFGDVAYTAAPRQGLWLLVAVSFPLLVWTGYRIARLRIRNPVLAGLGIAVLTAATAVVTFLHMMLANYSG